MCAGMGVCAYVIQGWACVQYTMQGMSVCAVHDAGNERVCRTHRLFFIYKYLVSARP